MDPELTLKTVEFVLQTATPYVTEAVGVTVKPYFTALGIKLLSAAFGESAAVTRLNEFNEKWRTSVAKGLHTHHPYDLAEATHKALLNTIVFHQREPEFQRFQPVYAQLSKDVNQLLDFRSTAFPQEILAALLERNPKSLEDSLRKLLVNQYWETRSTQTVATQRRWVSKIILPNRTDHFVAPADNLERTIIVQQVAQTLQVKFVAVVHEEKYAPAFRQYMAETVTRINQILVDMKGSELSPAMQSTVLEAFAQFQSKTQTDLDRLKGDALAIVRGIAALSEKIDTTNNGIEAANEGINKANVTLSEISGAMTRQIPNKPKSFIRLPDQVSHFQDFNGIVGTLMDTSKFKPGTVSTLYGHPGMGKTTHAAYFASKYHQENPEADVWFFELSQINVFYMEYAKFYQTAGYESSDIGAVKNGVVEHLSATCDTTSLLVIDNADEWQDLSAYIPQIPKGKILITSRDPQISSLCTDQGNSCFELGQMPSKYAMRYIRELAPNYNNTDADKAALEVLVGKKGLDGLPLALSQAAGYMNFAQYHCTEYLELFQKYEAQLLKNFSESEDGTDAEENRRRRTVHTTVVLAANKLKDVNQAAYAVLVVCAFANVSRVPQRLFTGAAADWGEPIQSAATTEPIWRTCTRSLAYTGLIRRVFIDGIPQLEIHRLTQTVMRDKISSRETNKLSLKLAVACTTAATAIDWPQYMTILDMTGYMLDINKTGYLLDTTEKVTESRILMRAGVELLIKFKLGVVSSDKYFSHDPSVVNSEALRQLLIAAGFPLKDPTEN